MKYLVFLLLFVGCNSQVKRVAPPKTIPVKKIQSPKFIPKSVRMEKCVHKLLKVDVQASTAINVCERIFLKK